METRSGDKGIRYYGYNYPCGTPNYSNNVTDVPSTYEEVESYRGKPQYIVTNGRRRRKYNAFSRFSYEWSGTSTMSWCPSGSWTMWAMEYPLLPLHWFCAAPYSTYWTTNGSGELPPMHKTKMAEYAEPFRTQAIESLYNKVNAPDFDALVFLAELKRTLIEIRDILGGTLKALVKVQASLKTLKYLTTHPDELWLWYRYSLLPTMMDVEALISAIGADRYYNRVQDGDQISATALSGTAYQKWSVGNLPMSWECSVSGGVGCAIDVARYFDPNKWGTSAIDVVRAGWELIPYSFIFDWFVNVGDWLTNLRNIELVVTQSYATFALESTTTCVAGANQTVGGNATMKCFYMERITDIEPPNFPTVDKEWLTCTRFIDLISLTIGSLRRGLK